MFILKIVKKIIKILGSAASPNQIAWGFSLGMILGLTPFWSPHNLIVIVLIILLNVNIGSAVFGWAIFSGFAYLLDGIFHSLGYLLLVGVDSLQGVWTFFYNSPFLALFRLNNTVVLGSLIIALLALVPVVIFMKWFVVFYRNNLQARVQKFKIVKLLKGSKIYTAYEKIKLLGA